ncbi:50S ribosomal protein L4 [Candidatus Saccharibacteria bacterium]|jgi:large subunit ribosomal protein L4|nr:50S ribosomal protein L4 [Candidatus Saccharibacteria bacterium]
MAVATYTKSGTKATTAASLDKKVFAVEIKSHELLKQAYQTYLANGRVNNAKTKKRGQVSGGGAKPWRQKGTGRARFGSSRNPIWTGGGVAFGPTGEENYSKKLNVAAKRTAIRQALTMAAKEDRIKVVEAITFADGKVKAAEAFLKKIGAEGTVLLLIEDKTDMVDRATRNIGNVKVAQPRYANVFDVLNADVIVITRKSLEELSGWLGAAK